MGPYYRNILKNPSKWIKDLNIKPETSRRTQRGRNSRLVWQQVFGYDPKAQSKNKEMGLYQTKNCIGND
jgi:hypothetical protein